MTIRIEITAETPEQYRAFMDALTGHGPLIRDVLRAAHFQHYEDEPSGPLAGKWEHVDHEPADAVMPGDATGATEQAAAHPDEGGPAVPVDPAPAKPKRQTKAEREAAKAAEAPAPLAAQVVNRAISESPEDRTGPQDTPATEQATEQPSAQPEPTIETVTLSHDDIRRALKVIVDGKGMPVATKALMDLGYGKTSDVPAEKIAEVIAALQKVAA